MGAIWFTRASLTGTVGEMVGYRSGITAAKGVRSMPATPLIKKKEKD
jgi:hypothetical protein